MLWLQKWPEMSKFFPKAKYGLLNMATFAMKKVAMNQKISWPSQSEIWPHWPFMATVGNTED